MKPYTALLTALHGEPGLRPWLALLPEQLSLALDLDAHGDLARWQALVDALPGIAAAGVDFNADCLRIGAPGDTSPGQHIPCALINCGFAPPLPAGKPPRSGITKASGEGWGEGNQKNAIYDRAQYSAIEQALRQLHPWRKGPYCLHGIHIDTEWRSDWKWQRLAPHIAPLTGKLVLDVGCGNGYHCWRMLGAGARRVIGVDPTLLSVMQFQAIKHFAGDHPVDVLPLSFDAVPPDLNAFDSVFSMGVLYHLRSPIDHLLGLKGCLKAGGQLILETLIIDGGPGQILVPADRYAKMRNVWFIPSPPTLQGWLQRCGFRHVRLIDVTPTRTAEQRSTDWMRFHSLADFLDPGDPSRTAEGLPAPTRAIFLAEKPGG
ncbi:MAG: tRNA 5-methoxyuridine(34)/uridine 5-oxyacetic acid(34) synthase CmoB [Methylococcaceae bacterium]|nr:MAG: tRNA 5-methoxyuridine(34)/uridine 5-oxyacetic acid(34) synthase CmoB [Methylococcaceae bacterium]